MKKMYGIFALCFAYSMVLSGQFEIEDISNIQQARAVFKMYKAPCFGYCPEYELTVYDNLSVLYDGKSNTEKQGKFYKVITKKEYRSLKRAYTKANFMALPEEYSSEIADDLTVKLFWFKNGESKVVKGKSNRPSDVLEIQKRMEEIADTHQWFMLKVKDRKSGPNSVIPNQIIVQLRQNVDMPDWVRSYSQYGMFINNKVTPNMGYLVVGYTENIAPKEILKVLRGDENVLNAQLNRVIDHRESRRN